MAKFSTRGLRAFLPIFASALLGAGGEDDGFMRGTSSPSFGTYNTAMQELALPYQKRILKLENEVDGLSQLADRDLVEQSEAVYITEAKILRLNQDIANLPEARLSAFERQALLYGTARVYANARTHAERLNREIMRAVMEKGATFGQQRRAELPDGWESLYDTGFKTDDDLTEEEFKVRYKGKLARFLKRGGKLSEIKLLTEKVYQEMGPYTRIEYVVRANDEIWVTEGTSGHLLLSGGRPVKAAGQLVFLKNNMAEFTMAIISNFSGTFKPDILSAERLRDRFQYETGIHPALVVVTKGEPVSAEGIEIYLKTLGVDSAASEKKIREIGAKVKRILDRDRSELTPMCGTAFG